MSAPTQESPEPAVVVGEPLKEEASPLDHPLIQTFLMSFVQYVATLPELEKQRALHAHEQQMQRERLHYQNARWSSVVGLIALTIAVLLLLVLAVSALVLLDRGILNERMLAQAGVVLGAIVGSIAVARKAAPPASPPPQ